MTHGSLFSGIGGFDLAAEWMGWENKFHCEFNQFGQKVLKYYWPNAQSYDDITESTFTIWRGKIDILTGGFPCQPYSTAGKRLGKEDSRHLWPEMLRVIREVQPRYIVGENVRGLISWNGGLVFNEVQSDLESEGYEVLPLLLPAAGINAPHRRDRIWFVAYRNATDTQSNGRGGRSSRECENGERKLFQGKQGWGKVGSEIEGCGREWDATDSLCIGSECREERKCSEERSQSNDKQSERCSKFYGTNFQMFPTVSPICNGDDGLSDRLDSITFSKWRKESIKAGGNAIVPQVVYQIFKVIEQIEKL